MFYSLCSFFIYLISDSAFTSLPKDVQRRLVMSSSWSYGVSVLFILVLLGIQIFVGLFTAHPAIFSVRIAIASGCLVIILPICISLLTIRLWNFIKVRDRIYERRCDPIFDLFIRCRLLFMAECGGISLCLAIFIRELNCSSSLIDMSELNVSEEKEEWIGNEKSLFLLIWTVFTGAVFAGKMFVCNADTLVFRSTDEKKLHEIAIITFKRLLPRATKVTVRQMVYFLPIYYAIFRLFRFNSIFCFLLGVKESSSNFILSVVFNIPLMMSSMIIGLCLHVILGTLLLSLRIHSSQALSFPLVRGAFDCETELLQTYLQTGKPVLLQYMALQQLAEISRSPSPNDRKPVFQLSELGGHAHTWNAISMHCRSLMTAFLKEIKAANANLLHKGHIPRTIAMQRTVLPEHLLARLHVGDSSPLGKAKLGSTSHVEEKRNLSDKIHHALMQLRLVQFIQAPLPFSVTMRLFSGSQAVLWAAETMANLAVASVVEDEFGVVQRDLVDIFELLTGTHEAVEKHLKLSGLYSLGLSTPPTSVALLYSEPDIPFRFRSTLNRAVLRLVEAFSGHLDSLEIKKETRTIIESMTRMRRS